LIPYAKETIEKKLKQIAQEYILDICCKNYRDILMTKPYKPFDERQKSDAVY
jgi:hypothetical protein